MKGTCRVKRVLRKISRKILRVKSGWRGQLKSCRGMLVWQVRGEIIKGVVARGDNLMSGIREKSLHVRCRWILQRIVHSINITFVLFLFYEMQLRDTDLHDCSGSFTRFLHLLLRYSFFFSPHVPHGLCVQLIQAIKLVRSTWIDWVCFSFSFFSTANYR